MPWLSLSVPLFSIVYIYFEIFTNIFPPYPVPAHMPLPYRVLAPVLFRLLHPCSPSVPLFSLVYIYNEIIAPPIFTNIFPRRHPRPHAPPLPCPCPIPLPPPPPLPPSVPLFSLVYIYKEILVPQYWQIFSPAPAHVSLPCRALALTLFHLLHPWPSFPPLSSLRNLQFGVLVCDTTRIALKK